MSSRDRPTLTASVEEVCEIHEPNRHNQSRQQQPPQKQTRKHDLALCWLTILPGWVVTRVSPGQNPQYTRAAHFGGKAVGCSLALQHTTMSPRKRNTITTCLEKNRNMRLKENERIGLSHCEDRRQAGHAAFVEEAIHCVEGVAKILH